MYHDRTVWRCAFFVGKKYGYPLLHPYFLPTKKHNATLFYRGTCIQGRRHLVTAATYVVMRILILVRQKKTR
jgi:hypothetical protein